LSATPKRLKQPSLYGYQGALYLELLVMSETGKKALLLAIIGRQQTQNSTYQGK
jgi:hypothetical protein